MTYNINMYFILCVCLSTRFGEENIFKYSTLVVIFGKKFDLVSHTSRAKNKNPGIEQ